MKRNLWVLTVLSIMVLAFVITGAVQTDDTKGGCGCKCTMMKDVKMDVANTANGATITLSSDNAETVKAIQEHAAMMAKCQAEGCKTGEMAKACDKCNDGCKGDKTAAACDKCSDCSKCDKRSAACQKCKAGSMSGKATAEAEEAK